MSRNKIIQGNTYKAGPSGADKQLKGGTATTQIVLQKPNSFVRETIMTPQAQSRTKGGNATKPNSSIRSSTTMQKQPSVPSQSQKSMATYKNNKMVMPTKRLQVNKQESVVLEEENRPADNNDRRKL